MLRRAVLIVLAVAFVSPPALGIIGGSDASLGEYPWMAALYSGSNPASSQYCGGSLVAPTIVVTAAHCMSLTGFGALGAVDETLLDGGNVLLGQTALNGAGGERIAVVRYHIHPQYNGELETDHDVAILELATASTQTPIAWARPSDAARYAPGVTSTIIGWGVTDNGATSNKLKEATVPIVSDATCDEAYDGAINPPTQLCAGFLGTGGVDTCQGDSGGPLMVPKTGGGFLLAGITSWGQGCAEPDFPGVYTEVASVSDFIDQWA